VDEDRSYPAVAGRKNDIMTRSLGLDYSQFRRGGLAFDYEALMRAPGYSTREVQRIQGETGVGQTPLLELHNLTRLVRSISPPGRGARIFIKDEACNPSGSFKARRAALSVHEAQRRGYRGVIAATSGNYGAAVASQAAIRGLNCIVVQEVFDSRMVGQPEILEKGRRCEAYGAEVIQLTVGPELFHVFLLLLEETGYFSASLYSPLAIAGIETLGYELVQQVREQCGRDPDLVLVTHAGGGNFTGTVRGIRQAGAGETAVTAVSVDLTGLRMDSDRDFNRKSFTTGHTGFGIPFATWPDRADVPINAARPLRYMERYVTVTQGEVFYITELLAVLEGLERGPAGNTSLAAAIPLARELPREAVLVVQETEYTGAGKLPSSQLTFARDNGIAVLVGDPRDDRPGENIVIPSSPELMRVKDVSLQRLRRSYIRNAARETGLSSYGQREIDFLAEDTGSTASFVRDMLDELVTSED